jgi:hypothetical protein
MRAMRIARRGWPFAVLLPLTASLAAADTEPKESYFDWQADNYAINQPLGGLTGVAERGRAIAGDPLLTPALLPDRLRPVQ